MRAEGATFDPRCLGVYVITSGTLVPGRGHREVAEAAIEGGATAIQLRAPELLDEQLLPLARDLAVRCREAGVLFVINDRPWIAVAADADGAHVGLDQDLREARERLGPERVLGASVADLGQARDATRAGVDYLGVTVWPTATKPDAVPRGLDVLKEIASASGSPVVGIGGITATNARAVMEAGAAGVAVISAVVAAADPVTATRALRKVVDDHRVERSAGGR